MNPKEKSLHTRAGEKTQHTIVSLPSDEGSAIQAAMKKAKQASQVSPEKKAEPRFKNESARQ